MAEDRTAVRWATLFAVFLRIGLMSFGGPAAQIALMHRMLVEDTRWLSERQFMGGLSFCMLLPGPEAMQLATYAGWRLRGVPGGLLAGGLFVGPGALVILALAWVYVAYGDVPLVETLFLGIKAAVLVIVLEALLRVSRKALRGPLHWALAAAAFGALFFFALPYPLIVVAAALVGAVAAQGETPEAAPPSVSWRATLLTLAAGVVLWLGPLWLLDAVTGSAFLTALGLFFAKLAVVTFGGAYAVLAYMAQDVVTGYGWLSAGEMMDGLGLAETTPGPLILVTQFVGFVAGHTQGGIGLALAATVVTLWVTFVPCFLWIFAGAPYIDWIDGQPRLSGALSGITAAVVGVILNLAIWFALHVLFAEVSRVESGPWTLWVPDAASFDWRAGLLAVLCAVLLLRLHLGLGWVLAASALGAVALNAV